MRIDPSGQFIYLSLSKSTNNASTHVEHHVTADGYSKAIDARPKVGEDEPTHELYLYSLKTERLVPISADQLTDIKKKPSYLKAYGNDMVDYKENRKVIFHEPVFNKNGEALMDIRSYDNKDRWIVHFGKGDSTFTQIEKQHDEAWIGGPGIYGWNMVSGVLGWMKDDNTVYFQSEESGYSHLYTYSISEKKKTALTEGKFEIQGVELNQKGDAFFIHANKTHPGNSEFYTFLWSKNQWIAHYAKTGSAKVEVAPDERNLAVLFSEQNKPWELYLSNTRTKKAPQLITYSESDAFQKYAWRKPGVITFKGQDEKDVYARVYKPENAKKNSAAIIFVHGAGYLQNADHKWSGYYREYMFHNLLVDMGYTVLDIDYRASAGYGRDYRTAIYQHMGGWDLKDQISGKQFLVDSLGIDPKRVGMYGGSYGGFITLMALLTTPDEFACGAAIRSVTDWNHYNHEYTSNILNYPATDPEAYRKSSPIFFAENLKNPLLMLHGMVDDNVQFQDVVRLSQRFIELGKEDWEMAIYPVEAHGFVKAYSWADEYRRILELFNENLLK